MRTALVAIFAVWFIAGCTVYNGAHVYGAFDQVSQEDLHAATVAIQDRHPDKIYIYRVVSSNEVWLYITPNMSSGSYCYWIARRVNGKWQDDGGMFVIEHEL